jgi:hypothetical protein
MTDHHEAPGRQSVRSTAQPGRPGYWSAVKP